MDIIGRKVEAVKYGDNSGVSVYVHQKPGDCQGWGDQDCECNDMCAGMYAVVRFFPGEILATGLVPKNFRCKNIPALEGVCDLSDLEEIAQEPGWELRDDPYGTFLYCQDEPVAGELNCGVYDLENLFSEGVKETITRVKELKAELTSQPRKEEFPYFCCNDPHAQLMRHPGYMKHVRGANQSNVVRLINVFLARDAAINQD